MSRYLDGKCGIVAKRGIEQAVATGGMLASYGYEVKVERHCKFWLVHWTFPRLASKLPVVNDQAFAR